MFKKDNNSHLLDYTRQLDKRINDLSNNIVSKDTLQELNHIINEINDSKLENDSKIDTIIALVKNITSKFNELDSIRNKINEIDNKTSQIETSIRNEIDNKTSQIETSIRNEIDNKTSQIETSIRNEIDNKTSQIDTSIKNIRNIPNIPNIQNIPKAKKSKIYIEQIPDDNNHIKFTKLNLNKGTYFVDFSVTFVNNNIVNDASVILELLAKINNKNNLIGRSSHTWYGRYNGNDIYHGYQTVIINGVLNIEDELTLVEFYTSSIDQRHCNIVINLKEYPTLLRIY